MGKAIEDAGRSAAVIANADGGPPTGVDQLPPRSRPGDDGCRGTASAVARSRGTSPSSTRPRPAAGGWTPSPCSTPLMPRGLGPDASDAVLVEMSDLERADRDGLPLTGPERTAGLASPLQQADAMLGELLAAASTSEPRPGHRRQPGCARRLRPADGVRAGGAGGRARPGPQRDDPPRRLRRRCPTSARTVLDSLGLPLPDSMNSTPITSSGGASPRRGPGRRPGRSSDVVARFRDRTVGPVSVVYIVPAGRRRTGLAALALLSRRRALQAASWAVAALADPRHTTVSRSWPGCPADDRLGLAPFVVAVFVAAAAPRRASRRRRGASTPFLPCLGLVALNWLLQVVDIAARWPSPAQHAARLLADRGRALPGARATWPSPCSAASAGRGGDRTALRCVGRRGRSDAALHREDPAGLPGAPLSRSSP